MRLTDFEKQSIKETLKLVFGENAGFNVEVQQTLW